MKVSERLKVIDRLADELQERYGFLETSTFLRAFLPNFSGHFDDYHSPREMAAYALVDATPSILGEMVEDLGIESLAVVAARVQRPAIWADETKLRVFVSHLSVEKDKATRLREAFSGYGMSAFVAHEDIEPTLEWQVQIERALHSMELFVSVHTEGFSKSCWTQQEIGFATATGVKIISIRMGEDPTGFISKHQSLSRGKKTADEIASHIDVLLQKDERINQRYLRCKEQHLDDSVPF
ncbi:MAG: hypothetical protein A2885_12910 [Sphingopyxis sp. RIFCSPHIGHO2_01_FULL_65_24]|nr:MAG: hypothetical protein A2885_12910 [Sphingopyxis sp. RIFCSPHIGHO2_01_FULL_65_24]